MELIKVLIDEVEKRAKEISDGHYSILKFTCGYKVVFGTVDLRCGDDYEEIKKFPEFITLEDALFDLLKSNRTV